MTMRNLLSAGALALGALSVSPAAFAGPPGHPFERKLVPAPAPEAQASSCNCMMMKGDTAMRDQCMAMMSGHPLPSQPGAPG